MPHPTLIINGDRSLSSLEHETTEKQFQKDGFSSFTKRGYSIRTFNCNRELIPIRSKTKLKIPLFKRTLSERNCEYSHEH